MNFRKRSLSAVEAANYLDTHPEVVRRWIRNGELRATRLGRGGKLLIAPAELKRFLSQRNALLSEVFESVIVNQTDFGLTVTLVPRAVWFGFFREV